MALVICLIFTHGPPHPNLLEEKVSSYLELLRIESSSSGVFGVLRVDGRAFCLTLEPPDQDNQPRVSCIPDGEYALRRTRSPRFGETFAVAGVPGREHILFHPGNTVRDTEGCILTGQSFGQSAQGRGLLCSRAAFAELLARLHGQDSCTLSVRRALPGSADGRAA